MTRYYPAVPAPAKNIDALYRSVNALYQGYNSLIGVPNDTGLTVVNTQNFSASLVAAGGGVDPGEGVNAGIGVIYGAASQVEPTTAGNIITGFANEFRVSDTFSVDKVNGIITVDENCTLLCNCWILAEQLAKSGSEVDFGASLVLELSVTGLGSRVPIAVFDVAQKKTALRHLSVSFIRVATAGTDLSLYLKTEDLDSGNRLPTMDILNSTFEVAQILT